MDTSRKNPLMKTIRQIKLEHKVWQLFPDLDGNCLIRQKVHCAKLRASWLLLTWLTNRKIANLDWNDVTDDVTIGKFCSFLRSRNNKPGTLLTLAYILRSYSIQSAWACLTAYKSPGFCSADFRRCFCWKLILVTL